MTPLELQSYYLMQYYQRVTGRAHHTPCCHLHIILPADSKAVTPCEEESAFRSYFIIYVNPAILSRSHYYAKLLDSTAKLPKHP